MPKPQRRTLTAPPPRWLRRRLRPDQRLTLHILHQWMLGELLGGCATEATLWEWVAMAFTWSRVAQQQAEGEPEMVAALDLTTQLVRRWRETGRVQLVAGEHDAARQAAMVMDAIADIADPKVAEEATHWSEARLAELRHPQKEAA